MSARPVARRGRAAVPVLLLALLGAGCGVPQDSQPRPLDPAVAPFRLQPEQVPRPTGESRVGLYFVRDDRVVLTTRRAEGPVGLRGLLDLVIAGPTAEESALGRNSALPSSVTVEDVTERAGNAVITLGGPQEVVSAMRAQAVAQIVATLTPNLVRTVRFRYDGTDLRVPRGDGSLTEAPLTREDYSGIIATPPPGPAARESPAVPPEGTPAGDTPGAVTDQPASLPAPGQTRRAS
jgi:hypothetical protein